MSHSLSIKQKAFAFLLIASMLFGSFMVTAPRAQAETSYDEMVLMIRNLLEQITVLQANLEQMRSEEGGFTNQFAVGDEVKATNILKARSGPLVADNVVAIIPLGTRGTIIDGPVSGSGYTWWNIKYTNGVTGWSAANWLKEVVPVSTGDTKDTTVYGEIFTITSGENPTIKGKATGVDKVGFSISNGDKVYSSGPISVIGGVWSHKVAADLADGKYTVYLYINNKEVDQRSFEVGETTAVPLSIKVISPTSGTYNYGDTLTVKWEQVGEAPKGSQACVFLQSFTTFKEFLFEKCVDVAGAEPERSITDVITRTSGYDLAPGDYRAKVRIIAPSSPDGKDGAVLAVGKGAGPFTIKDESSNPTAGIASVTNEKNPLITGLANGVTEVGVSVTGPSGDKVYGSGPIPVVNGQWSHRVTTDFEDGSYVFKTYINNNEVHEFGAIILNITDPDKLARFKAVLNGTAVKAIPDITKQAASDACKVVYNDYATYNFKYGDVLDCYWNAQKFLTVNAWKG
jgi:uncharacterized protein YraI